MCLIVLDEWSGVLMSDSERYCTMAVECERFTQFEGSLVVPWEGYG